MFKYVTGVLMLLMFLWIMVTMLFGNHEATVPLTIGDVWLWHQFVLHGIGRTNFC
jgi:hypothetical protein